MASSYHILLSRYPIDSVLLALRAGSTANNLIVAPGAATETKNYFQLEHSKSLEWAINEDPGKLQRSEFNGRNFSFLIGCTNSASGLLPRLRSTFVEFTTVFLCLTYDRVTEDLPLLSSHDTVSLFWHTPDLLTEPYVRELEHLEEQLKAGEPSFSGLHFYNREQPEDDSRLKDLHRKTRLPKAKPTQIEGGHKWLKVYS